MRMQLRLWVVALGTVSVSVSCGYIVPWTARSWRCGRRSRAEGTGSANGRRGKRLLPACDPEGSSDVESRVIPPSAGDQNLNS